MMFLEFFWTVLRAKKFDKVSIVLPDFETIRNNTFFLFSFFLNSEIFETNPDFSNFDLLKY